MELKLNETKGINNFEHNIENLFFQNFYVKVLNQKFIENLSINIYGFYFNEL